MQEIRVRFQKTGRARYISHLDLTRAMSRAVRRAALPVWYTEGFNKHPYLTFAAPLSLGYEGLAESMDFRLIQEVPPQEIVRRLNGVLPEGLTVLSAAEPVYKAKDLAAARYRLTWAGDLSCFAAFLAQETIPAEKRTKKGGTKPLDLKPFLQSADGLSEDGEASGVMTMELTLPCGSSQNINPSLIAAAYNAFARERTGKEQAAECRVLRTGLFCAQGVPFA